MPKVTTIEIRTESAGVWHKARVDVSVNADGLFYANIPEVTASYFRELKTYGDVTVHRRNRGADPQIFARSLDQLKNALTHGMSVALAPEVKTSKVIRYNILSHVAFWETAAGDIVPNGYFASRAPDQSGRDGRWCGDKMFGNHHAGNPARGGYSLTIGATAEVKRIERIGEHEDVSYQRYYGNEDHFGTTHPAARLNGWKSFDLGNNPKEIPYSDDAAIYFFKLLHGMAEISRMIQNASFDQQSLMERIKSGTARELVPPSKS